MGIELLFLLLPIAAFSGWLVGRRPRRSSPRTAGAGCHELSPDYFRGLNFLLNEQADEAIEVFVRMVEVDSDTVELHFALANLFRMRGEADRAIRIHQNLIARPNLPREHHRHALFELGMDYMRAGLLDRAESLFEQLVNDDDFGYRSREQLLEIFQQEKEWDKAIEMARRLPDRKHGRFAAMVAHFHCELADIALAQGEIEQGKRRVKQAFAADSDCVRASILEGELLRRQGSFRAAIRSYKRVEEQDSAFLSQVTRPLKECFHALERDEEFIGYLGDLAEKYHDTEIVLQLTDLIEERQGVEHAMQTLQGQLKRGSTLKGVGRLIDLVNKLPTVNSDSLLLITDNVHNLLQMKIRYRCQECGYTSSTLNWQCPSCKRWGSIKPYSGPVADGEKNVF